jgi:hypothetical protein
LKLTGTGFAQPNMNDVVKYITAGRITVPTGST